MTTTTENMFAIKTIKIDSNFNCSLLTNKLYPASAKFRKRWSGI